MNDTTTSGQAGEPAPALPEAADEEIDLFGEPEEFDGYAVDDVYAVDDTYKGGDHE